jgi:quercetin dioxygenase-like cupin family protein
MDMIFPADNPRVAVLSGSGVRLRLEQRPESESSGVTVEEGEEADSESSGGDGAVGTGGGGGATAAAAMAYPMVRLRVFTTDSTKLPVSVGGPLRAVFSPGGIRVEFAPLHLPLVTRAPEHVGLVVRRLADQDPWVVGRAGMQYRDLVPTRLGGAVIASHIRIPVGGPVPDVVHYHSVTFQLIFCQRGWVDVVYEDQGPPMRLLPGDCVIQPPGIRHRVLTSSDGLEVVEIGLPAEHLTEVDHEVRPTLWRSLCVGLA